jgi:hypothetical protein
LLEALKIHPGGLGNHVVTSGVRDHGVLGGPLTDGRGRANLAGAAGALGDNGQVVLWTDVGRQEVEQAELHPGTPRLAAAAEFAGWARDHRVLVVDGFEVFHRDAPMNNAEAVLAEAALRRGYGYAAASNILRVEIMNRFGGMYFDHDEPSSWDLPQTLTQVLELEQGYAVHGRTGETGRAEAWHDDLDGAGWAWHVAQRPRRDRPAVSDPRPAEVRCPTLYRRPRASTTPAAQWLRGAPSRIAPAEGRCCPASPGGWDCGRAKTFRMCCCHSIRPAPGAGRAGS